ncbi:MAG: PAS domain-containing protein [Planctomycetes bacterium]|nr:PAS domain-containing protein [Planctomycetota bacterium]
MTVTTDTLLGLLEKSFNYVLVVDGNENVISMSRQFRDECIRNNVTSDKITLKGIFDDELLTEFRNVLQTLRDGKSSKIFYLKNKDKKSYIPLKTSVSTSNGNTLFLFWSNNKSSLENLPISDEYEQTERAKELACLYSVAEWIQKSHSSKEFFAELPNYLSKGMKYPESAQIYSEYQDNSYGKKPVHENVIRSEIILSDEKQGEITVFYSKPELALLPEEGKLLDEIARMLGLALDRKLLSEIVTSKQEESEEYNRRLKELEEEIEIRTKDLHQQHAKLDTLNSYLGDVSKGFEQSKVRLETMFKAIPDEMAIIDLQRNVIMTNRENVETGKKCYKTFFNSDKPCLDCRLKRIIREKTPITLEIEHEDEFYEVHAMPIFNNEHEVEGIIEFYRDITFKKTYEQQLQQADKLASLGQLVSGIGHEINNPNQFIRGNIKIIQQAFEDILPILDAYQKEHLELKIARLKYDFFRQHILTLVNDMANGSERIKRIVKDLKGFARKDEGLLIDQVDINNVIAESTRLVHNQVHNYAEIELELGNDIPMFQGNAQKIEQIIINLIINASQAMHEEKRGLIKVNTFIEKGEIVVKVEDNGKGMSEGTLNKIFDPFFTTKRAKGGTGLGLSIAYRIIEEHKGKISATSNFGEGTTFTIRIPIRKKSQESTRFLKHERENKS